MWRIPSVFFMTAMILPPASAQPIKIVLVGDSTVNDEGGWGTGFRASFGPPVECLNLAKNGRSSKSFREQRISDCPSSQRSRRASATRSRVRG